MKNLTLVAANRRDYVYAIGLLRVQKFPHRAASIGGWSIRHRFSRNWPLLVLLLLLLLVVGASAMQAAKFPYPGPVAAAPPPNPAVNEKYRRKYRRLKRIMKNLVFENAALCDQVAQIQENILLVKEERRYLLKKLLEHENDMETQMGRPCSKLNELIANSLPPKRQYKKRNTQPVATVDPNAPPGDPAATPTTTSTPKGKNQTRKPRANASAVATAKKNVSAAQNIGQLSQATTTTTTTTGHSNYPITVAYHTVPEIKEEPPDELLDHSERNSFSLA